MEQTKKNLKIISLIVLLFAALTLLNIVSELLFGALNSAELPEGSPENTLTIAKIFLLVISVLLLLPQVYVGLKGLKIAKNPNSSKGHIIWAGIILAFSVYELIDPVIATVKQGGYENICAVSSILLEVVIFFEYIKYARAAAKLSVEE